MRDIRLAVRLSHEEHDRLAQRAREAGMTVSEFVRMVLAGLDECSEASPLYRGP